jgi:endogenous inhibitor of DNA gyrase (YacG/DUF329 family)
MKVQCPACGKDVIWESTPTRPFCSERCRLIDLGDWAQEKYSVPDEHEKPATPSSENDESSGENPSENDRK